jgi:hypothetical protein
MRKPRELKQDAWYELRTAANNRENPFQHRVVVDLFSLVFRDAAALFDFDIRGLVLDKAWLSFDIKPANGYQLPEMMQWMMDISPLSRPSRSALTL